MVWSKGCANVFFVILRHSCLLFLKCMVEWQLVRVCSNWAVLAANSPFHQQIINATCICMNQQIHFLNVKVNFPKCCNNHYGTKIQIYMQDLTPKTNITYFTHENLGNYIFLCKIKALGNVMVDDFIYTTWQMTETFLITGKWKASLGLTMISELQSRLWYKVSNW